MDSDIDTSTTSKSGGDVKTSKTTTTSSNDNNNNKTAMVLSLEERLSLGPTTTTTTSSSPLDATKEWVIDPNDDHLYNFHTSSRNTTNNTTADLDRTPPRSNKNKKNGSRKTTTAGDEQQLQQSNRLTPSSSSQKRPRKYSSSTSSFGGGNIDGNGGSLEHGTDLEETLTTTTSTSSSSQHNTHTGGGGLIAMDSLRHASRVSRRAALATKEQFWDSNDAAVVVSQRAVDQWEQGYNTLRGLLKAVGHSAQSLYGAAKAGAGGIEHGLLVPVRDWILLPAFGGVEHVVGETIGFLQSDQTQVVAQQSLAVAKQVPWIGETVLVPSLVLSAQVIKTTWNVAQYPIPSPQQVRESVDTVLGGTKWALSTAGTEVFLYVKRADANITRTLSHTQWKVLGSGPYHTLDKLNKREVIDHLCERYFATPDPISRYELAAHIRAHNRPLYHDLVLTGLLRDRGRTLTADDEWLSPRPQYRYITGSNCFLLHNNDEKTLKDGTVAGDEDSEEETEGGPAFPLWFRLPYHNGQRPKRDTPWICFDNSERAKLETKYRSELQHAEEESHHEMFDESSSSSLRASNHDNRVEDSSNNHHESFASFPPSSSSSDWNTPKYPTTAQWLYPNTDHDLLLDKKRHAVSFFPCCPKCRQGHDEISSHSNSKKQLGELCDKCAAQHLDAPWVDALLSPPPLKGVYRPTMWRYYGPGDEIRRATWFLDTQRNGPQPYGEDAQAVLEDAYLFLKWISTNTRLWDGTSTLLTVQVPSPDGTEHQLVQFSSLTSATAIGKGLGSAISIFKRRVYRGAYFASTKTSTTTTTTTTTNKGVNISSSNDSSPKTTTATATPQSTMDESYTDDVGKVDDILDSSENDLDCSHRETTHEEQSLEINNTLSDMDTDDNDREGVKHPSRSSSSSPPKSLPLPSRRKPKGPPLALELKPPIDTPRRRGRKQRSRPHHRNVSGDNDNISTRNPDDDRNEVDHLVLVVHGIGEMMQSFDFFGLKKVPTIIECCKFLRDNHAEVLDVRFAQIYQAIDGMPETRFGRVEYLPVEWHEAFSIQSTRGQATSESSSAAASAPPSRRSCSINDISLRTIPNMRQFANDTLMDVLYFMNPDHHATIIDIVVCEMNYVVDRFRKLTGFNGTVSIVGHSLGSIIAWDILDHQRKNRPASPIPQPELAPPEVEEQRGMELSFPQLNFNVDNAFMLGSPIPVFLMIRNQDAPLSTDFALAGCPRVFNIFHPFDPVSYRIEPLLHPSNADIDPKIMTHWNGGYRFQYQTKRLWEKLVDQTLSAQESVVQVLESGIVAMGLLDSAYEDDDDDDNEDNTSDDMTSSRPGGFVTSSSSSSVPSFSGVVSGKLNGGRRIDYMLQEKELDRANEYVAALAAHSCYWLEKDLSLFIARQICLVALERASENATTAEDPI